MTRESVRASYSRWGAPGKFLVDDVVTTPKMLVELLSAIEPLIRDMGCRVFPSSFDPKDANLRAFPRPIHWHWTSCERTLRFFGARAVMTRLPHFWQLESPVHACCRNAGAPLFTNEPENMAVGAAAIVSANINTIIGEAAGTSAFISFLLERDVPLPALWLLIHKAGASEWNIPAELEQNEINVAQEVHLFPGVPVLMQCPLLAQNKKPLFHRCDAYAWDLQEKVTLITSIGDDPLPLYKYLLPLSLRAAGECPCGRTVVEKKLQ